MARGSRSRGVARSHTIATYTPPQDPLADVLRPFYSTPARLFDDVATPFTDFEDGRTFSPDVNNKPRRAVVIGGRPARLVVHKRPIIAYGQPIYAYRGLPKSVQVPVGVKFESPLRVIRCLRRKIRRNVIFALNKRRKGAGAKRRRRNEYSNVGC